MLNKQIIFIKYINIYYLLHSINQKVKGKLFHNNYIFKYKLYLKISFNKI